MKLYTEEQVRKAIDEARLIDVVFRTHEEVISILTPIELLSDEEIEIKGDEFSNRTSYSECFKEGANWVIEQIKQQDNGK